MLKFFARLFRREPQQPIPPARRRRSPSGGSAPLAAPAPSKKADDWPDKKAVLQAIMYMHGQGVVRYSAIGDRLTKMGLKYRGNRAFCPSTVRSVVIDHGFMRSDIQRSRPSKKDLQALQQDQLPLGTSRLPFTMTQKGRNGKPRQYFRRRGGQKVRLPDAIGSPEYVAAYQAALKASEERRSLDASA